MKSVTVESSLGLSLDKLGEKLHESMKAQEVAVLAARENGVGAALVGGFRQGSWLVNK